MAKMPTPRQGHGMYKCTCGTQANNLPALEQHWINDCKNNPDSKANKKKKDKEE